MAIFRALALAGLCWLAVPPWAAAIAQDARLPLIDAHIHYSHDAAEAIPAKEAVAILRKAGLKRVLVSSSDDRGTQALLAEAPDLIVPELRPYRKRSDVSGWAQDETILAYIEGLLAKNRYVGVGEFHVYGGDAELPVVRRVVALARQHNMFLHAHSDAAAIELLFKLDPQARILWAHSGFERPEKVREMLRKYPNLYCDLAFLTSHASSGKVAPGWREAFLEFPDRFVVGTDTFTPERWHYVVEHARWSRQWLSDLPPDVGRKIAYENGDRLFGGAQ